MKYWGNFVLLVNCPWLNSPPTCHWANSEGAGAKSNPRSRYQPQLTSERLTVKLNRQFFFLLDRWSALTAWLDRAAPANTCCTIDTFSSTGKAYLRDLVSLSALPLVWPSCKSRGIHVPVFYLFLPRNREPTSRTVFKRETRFRTNNK